MAGEGFRAGEVREAELVDVDEVYVRVFGGVGREVPGLDLVEAHLDFGDVADEVQLCVVLDHRPAGAEFFDLLLWVGEWGEFLFDFGEGVGVGHVDVGCGRGAVTAVLGKGRAGRGGGFGVIVAVFLAAGFRGSETFAVVAGFGAELFGLGGADVGAPAGFSGEEFRGGGF